MSRQWHLLIQGVNATDLADWLATLPYAARRGHLIDLAGGVAVASVDDLKPYQSGDCLRGWGVVATSEVEMTVARDRDPETAHLEMYQVAFEALRHFPADIAFVSLDVGVFARRDSRLIVNPEAFKSSDINALLEPPFWLADSPCHLLIRRTECCATSGSAVPDCPTTSGSPPRRPTRTRGPASDG
jgi:hypothetical protein